MYENQVCKWGGSFGNEAHQRDMRMRLIDLMGLSPWSVRKISKMMIISEATLSKFIKGREVSRGVLARVQSFVISHEKLKGE